MDGRRDPILKSMVAAPIPCRAGRSAATALLAASLALGVAFQAVETFAGLTLGLGGVAVLAAPGTPARKWSLAAAGAGAVLVAAAVGFTSTDLV